MLATEGWWWRKACVHSLPLYLPPISPQFESLARPPPDPATNRPDAGGTGAAG